MTSQQAWEKLKPFCPSIAGLIEDAKVSEIEANPSGEVFVERDGVTTKEDVVMPEDERETFCQQVARFLGKDISSWAPLIDARLPDGSRVAAICPPISRNWTFTIRKFSDRRFSLDDLVACRSVSEAHKNVLCEAVAARKTILVSGGTSTGKTSALNALVGILPRTDRIVLIEDTAEIRIDVPNAVTLESRPATDAMRAVTIRDLVKHSLRFRPDRIIVGEVRGAEAFDLLQALNSGHAGSMSTIHANDAEAAVYKLALYCQTASMDIPMRSLGASIADAINVVVQMRLVDGRRVVDHIVSVDGYNRDTETYLFSRL